MFATIALLSTIGSALAQQIEAAYALDGYARPGRYLPLHVSANIAGNDGESLRIHGDGILPVEVKPADGVVRAVVPILVLSDTPGPIQWSTSGGRSGMLAAAPRMLRDDERLVAFAGGSASPLDAAALFSEGDKIVPIALDLTRRPLLEPAAAFEVLDALVLDAAVAADPTALSQPQLDVLLAAGVTVAVRSDARPAGAWPWTRTGSYWVARHEVAWPIAAVEDVAYEPTYGWVRGWPAGMRRNVILLAALFCLAAVAATLWRLRWTMWISVAVSLAAAGALVAWSATRSSELSASGAVDITDGTITQRDQWHYCSTLTAGDVSVPFDGLTHPVFYRRQQATERNVRLVLDSAGQPGRIAATLPAEGAIAFVTRSVRAEAPTGTPTKPVTSRLYPLANRFYPGAIQGQVPAIGNSDEETWDTVVLKRQAP